MSARPEAIFAALAAQCGQATGLRALYPMRPEPPTSPTLVIMGSTLRISRTGNEQRWQMAARGLLLIPNTGEVHKHSLAADSALAVIADLFDPRDDVNAYRLGGLVQRCAFAAEVCNLYQVFDYAGTKHLGHELFWDIDARRFKGDA